MMRIRWTEPAARDLTAICDFIEEHDGPEAARPGGFRAVMFLDEIANSGEVAGGGLRPADTHHPGYRLLINVPTSSWSMNSPRSAADRPFSTSVRNQAS